MCARILIIDDNRTNLDLMLYLLTKHGHTPIGKRDPQTGLLAALEGNYDLCLCDILMPGIDGFEIAKRIKAGAHSKGKSLVAVTALAMLGDRGRVLGAGFDGYLPKPINPETFVAQVEAFLPKSLPNDAPPAKPVSKARVLIVDDLAINRKLMVTILEYGGYEVMQARNGAEAIEMARRKRPDLMIFDVNMPIMNGRQLIEELRGNEETKAMRLALYTASLADDELQAFVGWSGVRCIIEKPSEPTHVLQMVRSALEG